ncbi:MAG: transcription antitermination factor NusB [Rhizobiaceae bacterium]|nr:transcription antitermination factor NusB [Rhizobiaceae bacterium]
MSEPATANKRGAARLSAVQALYQMDISGAGISETVSEYEQLRIGQEVDGEEYLEADLAWFRGIVAGVVNEQTTLDPLIHEKLPDDWPLSRIDMLLRSVLRCGVFELMNRKDVPARVVIAEYLEVAKAFFDAEEPRLVNAVLDSIGRDVRSEDMKPKK